MSRSMNAATLTCLCAATATLTGCGGGGDDPPAPPPAAAYTQADVLLIAQLGALTASISQMRVPDAVAYFGGFLAAASTNNGGTTSIDAACPGGGTQASTVTKSAVRAGFATGDSIRTTYASCVVEGITFNGTVTLTLRAPIANLSLADFRVDYGAEMTGFSMQQGNLATVHNGRIDAISELDNANVLTSTFQVPANATYGNASGGFSMQFLAGATFAETRTASTSSGTLAMNANVSINTSATPIPLQISTGPALTGPLTSAVLDPTGGTLNTKDTTLNLATSTVFSGSTATVSGDTDQNGSLDLTFASSWSALVN